jgi:hypothetical protein
MEIVTPLRSISRLVSSVSVWKRDCWEVAIMEFKALGTAFDLGAISRVSVVSVDWDEVAVVRFKLLEAALALRGVVGKSKDS